MRWQGLHRSRAVLDGQWAGAGVGKLQNGLNRAGGQRSLLWQERLWRGVQVGVAGERLPVSVEKSRNR